MQRHAYRYSFDPSASAQAIESVLKLAYLATEFIHGSTALLVEIRYANDFDRGIVVIDGATPSGLSLNRLFAGFATREFGVASFIVEVADALDDPIERHAA